MHESGEIELMASTLMPDHLHLLLTLGHRLTVGQTMGKIKTLAREKGRAAWRWQDDGFEHQLRVTESIEDYGFYIFMNPHKAGLCSLTQAWPWWFCPDPHLFAFLGKLNSNDPVPSAWLDLREKIASRIAARGSA
jgi:hypothetical protein